MQFQMIQLSCCFWKNGVFCNFHANRKFAIPELPQSNLFSEWGTNVIGYLSFAGNNSERVDNQLFLISLHCFCMQNVFSAKIFLFEMFVHRSYTRSSEKSFIASAKSFLLSLKTAAAVTSSKTYFLEL